MKYRNGPVVVDAFRWTGGPDQSEDPAWICAAIKDGKVRFENEGTRNVALIIGGKRAGRGDWVVRDAAGELYPMKPYAFKGTYEPVSEAAKEG